MSRDRSYQSLRESFGMMASRTRRPSHLFINAIRMNVNSRLFLAGPSGPAPATPSLVRQDAGEEQRAAGACAGGREPEQPGRRARETGRTGSASGTGAGKPA
ncbi:hypothetical protein GCM10023334_098850 [Nonomuraea thailandensis]